MIEKNIYMREKIILLEKYIYRKNCIVGKIYI